MPEQTKWEVHPYDWEWYGKPGHLICADYCQFHLCTEVGEWLVSTVGEYLPPESIREIFAKSRGVVLEGKGDYREADYMKKIGYESIGLDRKYETMVFYIGEKPTRCNTTGCNCNMPRINGHEQHFEPANDAKTANENHMKACVMAACGKIEKKE
jgi:hypothetical protein